MRAKTEIGQGLIELRSRRSAAIGMRLVLVALLLGIAASAAVGQNMTHRLSYTPPKNTFRAGIDPSEDYSFNGFNASVQIYQFRPFSGNIVQTFQTTLLRDWIAPMHQEENVAGQPTFQKLEIPGAQLVVTASFAENIVGLPKPHMRMVIISGSEAAIVDASAGTLQSWQMALPALNAMAGTLRVEAVRGPAPLTSAAGRGVAGLYMGMKQKYMATMVNVTGSGYYTNALHFYLFSADGRVYRAYDKLDVPGGDIARFDFDAASRFDPENSGHYTVDNGRLVIQMGGNAPESAITADVPRDGVLTINTVPYKKQ
jgi:hypothetical protein